MQSVHGQAVDLHGCACNCMHSVLLLSSRLNSCFLSSSDAVWTPLLHLQAFHKSAYSHLLSTLTIRHRKPFRRFVEHTSMVCGKTVSAPGAFPGSSPPTATLSSRPKGRSKGAEQLPGALEVCQPPASLQWLPALAYRLPSIYLQESPKSELTRVTYEPDFRAAFTCALQPCKLTCSPCDKVIQVTHAPFTAA